MARKWQKRRAGGALPERRAVGQNHVNDGPDQALVLSACLPRPSIKGSGAGGRLERMKPLKEKHHGFQSRNFLFEAGTCSGFWIGDDAVPRKRIGTDPRQGHGTDLPVPAAAASAGR